MRGKNKLTHVNKRGEAHMVDIAGKPDTLRRAVAQAILRGQPETITAIIQNGLKKGDALSVARIAGIMAAKKTSELIPLCHPIALTHVDVEISQLGADGLLVEVVAETAGKTGVEMEALTGASVAALTLYDMAKAIDRGMVISDLKLMEKSGGKSGDYKRKNKE